MFVLFIAILYLTSVRTLKMKVMIIMAVMRITMELIGLKLNLQMTERLADAHQVVAFYEVGK